MRDNLFYNWMLPVCVHFKWFRGLKVSDRTNRPMTWRLICLVFMRFEHAISRKTNLYTSVSFHAMHILTYVLMNCTYSKTNSTHCQWGLSAHEFFFLLIILCLLPAFLIYFILVQGRRYGAALNLTIQKFFGTVRI